LLHNQKINKEDIIKNIEVSIRDTPNTEESVDEKVTPMLDTEVC
jgi:hypothetical protein